MTRAKHKKFKSSLSNSFDMNFWYILFIWGENLIIQRREREREIKKELNKRVSSETRAMQNNKIFISRLQKSLVF
jgi:hypothetical protein